MTFTPKTRRMLFATTLALLGFTTAARAVPAVGLLNGTTLFAFDTSTPGTNATVGSVSGLQAGETLFGLDYRPATGALYGLGSSGTLYTISTSTGAATAASTLSTGLSGTGFDISFNPTVDRLRIVSNTGQNLRVNVDTGVVTTDTPLAFAVGDANAGATPAITAIGYTNQFAGAATTILYDIQANPGLLATQNPPNNGTLNTVGAVVPAVLGFDIAGDTGIAYAATSSSLYTLNLATGGTTLIGGFASATVTDFALVQAVPEPMSLALLGLGAVGLVAVRRRNGKEA